MRAAVVREFGGPDQIVIEDLPIPEPGDGEVRIRVHFAPVNPTDALLRSGLQAKAFKDIPQPWIPGMEFAGVIDKATGDLGGLEEGDAVMGIVNPRRAQGGAQAEYVIVPVGAISAAPKNLSLDAASMIPMNGLTAAMIIEALEPARTETVLVTGGAGILGGYVIQLARRAGMSVIAHCRPSDETFVRELGADLTVSNGNDLAQSVHELIPAGVDGLADTAVLRASAEQAVRDGGISVQVLPTDLPESFRIARRFVNILNAYTSGEPLSKMFLANGLDVLTPRVAGLVPLADISKAHEQVQQTGQRGRLVLDLTDR